MVQYYNLFGAKVGSHYLAMGVLAALFGGTSMAIGGGSKKATQTPPLNAASPDEADFIKYIHPGPALVTESRNIWVNADIMAGNSWMRQRRAVRKRSIRRHWTPRTRTWNEDHEEVITPGSTVQI
ncbi:hypothetical protein VSDG_02498 [Cytospora chrysosperma]|uniref:Uncharacterized protein n=1 Tax=Cytospora chrysosperma TaxID=252740 RepID=A0A423WFF8_CYTCH|nr:hypothetical protein VSDG_02498 [Valsa sordida]